MVGVAFPITALTCDSARSRAIFFPPLPPFPPCFKGVRFGFSILAIPAIMAILAISSSSSAVWVSGPRQSAAGFLLPPCFKGVGVGFSILAIPAILAISSFAADLLLIRAHPRSSAVKLVLFFSVSPCLRSENLLCQSHSEGRLGGAGIYACGRAEKELWL